MSSTGSHIWMGKWTSVLWNPNFSPSAGDQTQGLTHAKWALYDSTGGVVHPQPKNLNLEAEKWTYLQKFTKKWTQLAANNAPTYCQVWGAWSAPLVGTLQAEDACLHVGGVRYTLQYMPETYTRGSGRCTTGSGCEPHGSSTGSFWKVSLFSKGIQLSH
jgi:hypothetical protein